MRWPIRTQLLLPLMAIVLVSIAGGTAVIAWWRSAQRLGEQEANMQRMVATLSEATFPLTERVLEQMSGLSGAEFIMLDNQGNVQSATMPLDEGARRTIWGVRTNREPEPFSTGPVIELGQRTYYGDRVEVPQVGPTVRPGSLVVLYPVDRWWANVRRATYPVLAFGALVALAVMLLSTYLARRLVQPIKQLGRQAAAIAGGDFKPIAVTTRDDEIRDLALSINRMSEQLSRYETEVRRSERLRTLGQLGAGMAHQLRNSATGASMAIELHERECPIAERCESLDVATRQLKLIESHLQRFLTLGRTQSVPHAAISLGSLVGNVLELVRPTCDHAKIDLNFRQPGETITVEGDAEALRQLVANLVLNAVEAVSRPAAAGARVEVVLARNDEEMAVLEVKDTGPGPADETRDKLFEPFTTDKPDGTGLGLYVARQVVEAHGGTIDWQHRDGITCFCVELPLLEDPTGKT